MKKFFKITKNDQTLGIILLVMSIISIVLGILIKYNYLQLSSDFFKNPDILSWILIILGILSLIYPIYVTIVAYKMKDDI